MNSKVALVLSIGLLGATVGWSPGVLADDLDISPTPLFAAVSIDPNIMFTLDDSGSMQWEYMPDGSNFSYTIFMFPRPGGLYGGTNYANQVPSFRDNSLHNYFGRSAANNGVFYNPDITYRPWANADGSSMPDANPNNALYNPDLPGLGGLNLRAEQTQEATWFRGNAFNEAFCDPCGGDHTYWPITYYNYLGGDRTDRDSYQRVRITSATGAGATFTSPGGITRTRDEEIQNFANWFQYSRSRILAARNGIGRAFTELPAKSRVGFAAINKGSSSVDGVNSRAIIDGVRSFTGADRQGFYDRLYGRVINNSGTPLRLSAEAVGEYFSRTDSRGPWSTTPGTLGGEDLACRQSYHILMTDGFWNGGNPSVGDADNTNGPTHTSPEGETYQYTPTDPFSDNRANTLADVAMYYWKRDLRTLANRVPTNATDPAFWQHLTTFGIGLGVTGNLDPEDVFQAVEDGTAVDWGDPFNNNQAKIDDLLHFGINGRGGFFSAADPDTFAAELGAILRDITARAGATTGLSASSTRLNQGAVIYTAGFDSEDWSGEVLALDANTGDELESAADRLELLGPTGRSIFTYDPVSGSGVAFAPGTNLTPRVMADAPVGWDATALFAYLSGDLAAGGGAFRARTSMLGDIVNSQPRFSGPGNEGWGLDDNSYFTYIDGPKRDPRDPCDVDPCPGSRRNTVFIGANDGMLHAFDALTLEEHFAYVPAAVHQNLHTLADPDYTHRFFVDGQMTVGDAKPGSSWGTYLVGTLGAGGRGVYALDVTTPQSFNAGDVKWEITSEDDPDIGYTYDKPAIGRLSDGTTWVAVFGNGYNSQDNQAYLYVVNLASGNLIEKVALGDAGSNGLSGVAIVGSPDDPFSIDRVYAGDLEGNMWRVDVSGSDFTPAFGGTPLFTDPDGRAIIAAPNVALHPVDGYMVYYGSGKLIEPDDRLNSAELDRFWALRDIDSPIGAIGDLDEVIVSAGPDDSRQFQASGPAQSGWYVDLALGTPVGERVLFSPQVFAGRVLFNSYEPANDPCTPGGIARVFVLSALSGDGALSEPGCLNCGDIVIGPGAAVAPVLGIRDAQTSPGTPGDPGVPNPPPGDDPTDPTIPPPVITPGDNPEGWCREYGVSVPPATFIRIGTICEGRQAWREIR